MKTLPTSGCYRKGALDSGYVTGEKLLLPEALPGIQIPFSRAGGQYHYYLAARSEGGLVTASEPLCVLRKQQTEAVHYPTRPPVCLPASR